MHGPVRVPYDMKNIEDYRAGPVRGPKRASHGVLVDSCELFNQTISIQPCQAVRGPWPDVTTGTAPTENSYGSFTRPYGQEIIRVIKIVRGPWLDVTEALVSLPLWGVILKKLIVVKILHIMLVPHACGGEFWEFNSNVWDVVVGNKNRAFWYSFKCFVFGSSYMTKLKVCATSCRCAFDLIVSNRMNLSYKIHLDSYTVGYRYNAVQYIMLFHTIHQWQQQNINQTLNSQKTLYHVQAMGCLLWGSGENYIVMIPSRCIWIFLKHNSLRSNDTSVSYIIIGWDDGFSLAWCQAII